MANILFNPPLEAETEVQPATSIDTAIKLEFICKLASAEWRHLRQQGAVIEIWSDLPVQGTSAGRWHAAAFGEDGTMRKVASSHKESDIQLTSVVHVLSRSESRCSYTYRIRFPDGRLQWLGNYESNGHVTIKSQAYWTPAGEGACLGQIFAGANWKVWGVTLDHTPRLLSSTEVSLASGYQTLLLIPDGTLHSLQNTPLFLFFSACDAFSLKSGQILCETPEHVAIYAEMDVRALLHKLQHSGLKLLPTSVEDCFFIALSSRNTEKAVLSLSPIWLSSRIPAKVKIKSSDIALLLSHSDIPFVLYLPGDGPHHPNLPATSSQPILPQAGEYEVPLAAGFQPLSVVRLQAIPGFPGQLVGVANPAAVLLPSASLVTASSPSSTETSLTAVSSESYPKGATVTVSKRSGVLFARTVPLPRILVHLIDRLIHVRILGTFYRLILYILSLVIPFFGVALSLRWSSIDEHKPSNIKASGPLQEKTTVSSSQENALYFDLEPGTREICIVFRGDVPQGVKFTLDGKVVNGMLETWLGDDLHQFSLQVSDAQAQGRCRLGVRIDSVTVQ